MINMLKIANRTLGFSACRSVASVLLVALFVVVSACGTINDELPSYAETSIVNVGDRAPEFSATTLDGELVRVGGESSVPTLLILFSHTCPDCKMLLDDMKRAKGRIDELDLCVLLVARDGNEGEVAAYMSDNGYDFAVAPDANRAIYNLYATMYVPRTYLIDGDGIVQHTTIEYEPTYVEDIIKRVKGC
jgi:peroxiredoxin